ncbi:MAG: hypothetical protein WCA19_23145 [Candidatus Acidiferrales bacterium]
MSPETEKRVVLLFPPDQQERVRAILLEECGNNLPFLQNLDGVAMERFRFAALKLSHGDLAALRKAVDLAKTDWRDLLNAANFQALNSHESWLPEKTW